MDALLIGLKYDVSVVAYWLSPAFLLQVLINFFSKMRVRFIRLISSIYLVLGFLFLMLICIADINYFHHYSAHIGASALNWSGSPAEVISLLWDEPAVTRRQ